MDVNSVSDVIAALTDMSTPTSVLRSIAEAHDLNRACERQCDMCGEFFEEMDYEFVGNVIAAHPNCDAALTDDLLKWVTRKRDGEWYRLMCEAISSNPRADLQQLLETGCTTEVGGELLAVKRHPKMTPALAEQILAARGWTQWPSDEYLRSNDFILNDADDLEDIQA